MEDQSLVRSAKTVEEAIELATLELGVGRDEIEIDVISQGRSGILGIGSEDARVRVRRITDGDGSAAVALGIVERFLDWMDVEAVATIRSSGWRRRDAHHRHPGAMTLACSLATGSETLRAFQFLVNLSLGQRRRPLHRHRVGRRAVPRAPHPAAGSACTADGPASHLQRQVRRARPDVAGRPQV